MAISFWHLGHSVDQLACDELTCFSDFTTDLPDNLDMWKAIQINKFATKQVSLDPIISLWPPALQKSLLCTEVNNK